MSYEQSSEGTKPRDRPLDNPALAINPQAPAIFIPAVHPILAIRTDPRDAAFGEALSQRVAVVGAIPDQALRLAPVRRHPRRQGLVDERDLGRRGRGEAYSQRNTLTLHQYHALCAFPALGRADVGAPFFAGAKVPSMNAVSHASLPRSSSSVRNARQMRSHVPSSNQRCKRRQHVAGLGYSAGKSRHRAPVLSTHRMPSITARASTQGRPPRAVRGIRGSSGSIWAHCASVNRTPRLATRTTSGQRSTKFVHEVQVLIYEFTGL
jgi:hypothetical protein